MSAVGGWWCVANLLRYGSVQPEAAVVKVYEQVDDAFDLDMAISWPSSLSR